MLKLASDLKEKYEFLGDTNVVVLKKDFTFTSPRYQTEIIIPKEHVFVSSFKDRNKRNLITRCVPKITHAYLLKIKDDLNIQLSEPELIRRPDTDEDLWGYCIVKVINTDVYGDGEVHEDTLPGKMYTYAFTMMVKRAMDRAISNAIGLYTHGFYTESEDIGDDEIVNRPSTTVDYDDVEREDDGVSTKENSDSEEEEKPAKAKKRSRGRPKKEKEPKEEENDDADEEEESEYSKPSKPEEEEDQDEPDDTDDYRDFLVKRIKLLSELTAIPFEEMAFDAVIEEGKDIKKLDDLLSFKATSLKKLVKRFETDLVTEDLQEMLLTILRNYKTEEKLSMKNWKKELADVIDEDPAKLSLESLTVSEIYEIIDVLDLWEYV